MPPRKSSQKPIPEPLILSPDQIRYRIGKIMKCVADLEAFEPQQVQKRNDPEVECLEAAIREALLAAFGDGTPRFNIYIGAANIDQGPRSIALGASYIGGGSHFRGHTAQDFRPYLVEGKDRSIKLLRNALAALEDDLEEFEAQPQVPFIDVVADAAPSNKVFIVHGHNKAVRESVARFLQKLGLEAVILDEQPNRGRTIIEKFEEHAQEVGFAVVLLTPDDVAGSRAEPGHSERARQNVIYELGFLRGKLGKGKVCLLRKGEVEIPSDLAGVVYTKIGDGDGWKFQLVKELKAAKLPFSADRAFD